MPDILFILVLALVIFGPKRLPEVARQVAKFLAQFRMMRDDVRRQIENELLKIELEEKEKKPAVAPPPSFSQQPPPQQSQPQSQLESSVSSATPEQPPATLPPMSS